MVDVEADPVDASSPSSLPMPSVSVDALIAARDNMLATLLDFERRMREARAELARFNVPLPTIELAFVSSSYPIRFPSGDGNEHRLPGEVRSGLDRSIWLALFELSNMADLMDEKTRNDLRAEMAGRAWGGQNANGDGPPEVTAENIEATFRGLAARADEFFGKALESVYHRLSWCYKTNRPHRFGEKLILHHALDGYMIVSARGTTTLGYHTVGTLADLERCACIVVGDPIPTHRSGVRLLGDVKLGEWVTVPPTGKRPLMEIKVHRNRNAHVRFLALDVVEKMNLAIARFHPFAIGDDEGSARKRGAR